MSCKCGKRHRQLIRQNDITKTPWGKVFRVKCISCGRTTYKQSNFRDAIRDWVNGVYEWKNYEDYFEKERRESYEFIRSKCKYKIT